MTNIDPQLLVSITEIQLDTINHTIDNHIIDTQKDSQVINILKPRIEDTIVIEDYTIDTTGLKNLRNALNNRDNIYRPIRIAFVGDSYVEGDIFSQHIREGLQNVYGGSGVGYMNMHSEFPGFRRSIRQSSNGWQTHDFINKNINTHYLYISQQYFTPKEECAHSSYKGTDYAHHLNEWNCSKFLFISSSNTTINLKTSGEWISHNVIGAKDSVQCIETIGHTNQFSLKTNSNDIIGLGVWLEDLSGITVDCMSTRGSSGISLSKVNMDLTRQISKFIQYDMIILEFGMNAMTPGQTDFSAYMTHMGKVITHMRNCYPNADLLIMGVGDRGEKIGGIIKTMRGVEEMIKSQRQLAQKHHCLFWDTREAMGGENSAANWANRKPAYVNKDYIHLSYKGGQALADEFVKSLLHALNE